MGRLGRELLKELKRAYKYYVDNDVRAFDETMARIVLGFCDTQKIVERIKKELGVK
ncbi:MAG: hypothetical protein QXG39_04715 [Candidatus Aenigmatarchaeota archaeon]